MTMLRCPSDILITSWLFTTRCSTWPGNHLVPCVAELVGSCILIQLQFLYFTLTMGSRFKTVILLHYALISLNVASSICNESIWRSLPDARAYYTRELLFSRRQQWKAVLHHIIFDITQYFLFLWFSLMVDTVWLHNSITECFLTLMIGGATAR